ncbi:MAG TPA: hypothetical protein VGB74_05790 [Actinoplanes sp.]|jgi:hypothetical protein
MRTQRPASIRTRFALAALLGAGALSAAACAPPAEAGPTEAQPPAATSAGAPALAAAHRPLSTSSLPSGWRRCTNPTAGYSIGYPGRWHTTQIRPSEACAQFHPSRFTIPADSEYPLTALNVSRVTALPGRGDTEFERTLLRQKTTVGGRTAVRFETVSTGAGMDRAGTKRYGYVVRLGDGLISVHTTAEPGEKRYAAWKLVVNKAVRTLTAVRPSPAGGGCAAVQPGRGFYEGGRVASAELTTPVSRCTTISVSDVVDPANPTDRCQRFLVGYWPLVDGSLTYTEPVTACGTGRTVLARNIANNTKFIVLYDIDYLGQGVTFKVWR